MATYPAGNPGAFPLDPSTKVGLFRILYGDVTSEPYDPPVPDIQNYEEISDAEIEGFLSAGEDSVPRAIGFYYLYMAGEAAKRSRTVKDFDLQIDVSKRAGDLRAIADIWFGRADDEDSGSTEDAFEIVPTGTGAGGFIPEGTIAQWGRQYTWGRWR